MRTVAQGQGTALAGNGGKLGLLTGIARLVQDCKTSGCMFAGKIAEMFSLREFKHDLTNQKQP